MVRLSLAAASLAVLVAGFAAGLIRNPANENASLMVELRVSPPTQAVGSDCGPVPEARAPRSAALVESVEVPSPGPADGCASAIRPPFEES